MPNGFVLEETHDGFIIRRDEVEMRMSKEEFFSLMMTLNFWVERIQARTGEGRPIVSHPMVTADVWPDAIQGNILLALTATSGTQLVFSLPIPIAEGLVGTLSRVLEDMQSNPMARHFILPSFD